MKEHPAPAFDVDELRRLLVGLDRGLGRPLVDLRDRLDRLDREGGPGISAEQRAYVRSSLALSDGLRDLTGAFFEFAVLTRAPSPPALESIRLDDLVADLDRRFAATAEERELDWDCRRAGADALVATQTALCRRAIGQLVANALRFTPSGGRVGVVVERSGPDWSVTVTDDGPGIPAHARSKVFEPFYRLARDERAGTAGDGMGLALCKAQVDRLGGAIVLEPAEATGTRARVTFPVAGPRA
ncbi:MAG TPA: ATP-binding protein [Isosphaeraceae bacterium]|jgi:signal transduction histidine kinase|nr:ATP-binding protein [Isosphaeraceae bacterium]